MEGTTMTITDGGMVLIPVWEYEELVRESERLEIVANYLTNEKYPMIGTIGTILGIENEKAGEENGTEN